MMKNKKGFTLIEIIVCIGLLAVIGLTVGISVNKLNNKQGSSDEEIVISKIKSAADVYLTGNTSLLNQLYSDKAYITIKLGDLKTAGLISEELKDPKTGAGLSNDELVMASLDAEGTVKYDYPINQSNEEYLQVLNVYLEQNEVVDCNIGENTYNLAYADSDGNILKVSLVKDSEKIKGHYNCDWDSKNSSTPGTYKVKYTYYIDNGIKKSVTRNFIVQKPVEITLNAADKDTSKKVLSGSWANNAFTITASSNRFAKIEYSWYRANGLVDKKTITLDNLETNSVNLNNSTNKIVIDHSEQNTYILKYSVYYFNNEEVKAYSGFKLFDAMLELSTDIKDDSAYKPVVSSDENWHKDPILLNITTNKKPISGIRSYRYCVTAVSGACTPNIDINSNQIKIEGTSYLGKNDVRVVVVSNAGNISQETNAKAYYDNEAPVIKTASVPAVYEDTHSGMNNIMYYTGSNSIVVSKASTGWKTYYNSPSCDTTYYYFSYGVDNAGNESAVSNLNSLYGGACHYSSHESSNYCDDRCKINQISKDIAKNGDPDGTKQEKAQALRDANGWSRADGENKGDHTVDANKKCVTWCETYGTSSKTPAQSGTKKNTSTPPKSNSTSGTISKSVVATVKSVVSKFFGGKK